MAEVRSPLGSMASQIITNLLDLHYQEGIISYSVSLKSNDWWLVVLVIKVPVLHFCVFLECYPLFFLGLHLDKILIDFPIKSMRATSQKEGFWISSSSVL